MRNFSNILSTLINSANRFLNYNPKMQYRQMGNTGVKVSALGFGMLRLPMKNGHVDFEQTTPMVRRAIDVGVNDIDTGRVYLGGESEQAVGKVKNLVNNLEKFRVFVFLLII